MQTQNKLMMTLKHRCVRPACFSLSTMGWNDITAISGITMCAPGSRRLHINGTVSHYHVGRAKNVVLQSLC